jgi:hypothetical protein
MTAYYSDVITAKNANKVTNQPQGRKLRTFSAQYEAVGTVSGSTIHMFNLPAGFTPTRGMLVRDALGSGVTLAVGKTGALDDFLVATASNTANLNTALTLAGYLFAPLAAETEVQIDVGGATATGTINLFIEGFATID